MTVRAEAGPARLQGSRVRYGELLIKGLLGFCALISVATTIGIIAALFIPAFEFFQEVSIVDFLTGTEWAPLFEPALFGVIPLVVGTHLGDVLGGADRDSLRARVGDLPQRVRE